MMSAASGIAPASAFLTAHDAPESVPTMVRNHCPRCAGIGAHDPPEYAKAALERILKESPLIRYTDYVVGEGNQLFSTVAKLGLEGIVGKKADSLYIGGRTKEWLKIKTRAGNEAMKKRIETWGR